MKTLSKLSLTFFCLLMLACSNEDFSSEPPELENAVLATSNACTITSLTINNNQITVNTNGNAYRFIAIHDLSNNYALVEMLCDFWTGDEPPCDSGPLTSAPLPDGDYALKIQYGTGSNDFCWKTFNISTSGPSACENSAPFTVQGNQLSVTPETQVIRLSIHNSGYGFIEDLCDYWNGGAPPCNGTLTATLTPGNYFLRIQDGPNSGDFCFVSFSVN